MMKLVVVESPWRALTLRTRLRNEWYARQAVWDSIQRGEVPFAGHLLYTQILDDGLLFEREVGINLHCEIVARADLVAVYTDLGTSSGMQFAIRKCIEEGITLEERKLYATEGLPEYLEEREARADLGRTRPAGGNGGQTYPRPGEGSHGTY